MGYPVLEEYTNEDIRRWMRETDKILHECAVERAIKEGKEPPKSEAEKHTEALTEGIDINEMDDML